MPKESLIVIDMQEGMLKRKEWTYRAQKVGMARTIIQDFSLQNKPIIYTVTSSNEHGGVLPELLTSSSQAQVITKEKDDAFFETDLSKIVAGHLLYIIGCNYEYCVKETATSANLLGFGVVLYLNAILTRDSSDVQMKKTKQELSKYSNFRQINYSPTLTTLVRRVLHNRGLK